MCFFETDAIANVSSGSTVKYFDQAANRNGKVTFSDSVYPNPIAAIAPTFFDRGTVSVVISRYYYSENSHYWKASSPISSPSLQRGHIVRVFYI